MTRAKVDIFTNREGRKMVRVTLANGLSEFPVRHSDGTIGYDHPEQVPKYIRPKVAKAFIKLEGPVDQIPDDAIDDSHELTPEEEEIHNWRMTGEE